jgi:hypothetical protein
VADKFHIAIGVANLEASIEDYSRRLRCRPCTVIPHAYALWRTDTLNFSIRCIPEEAGSLRHLGWEDQSAPSFSKETDVNGIPWERFAAHHQEAEIRAAWPESAAHPDAPADG